MSGYLWIRKWKILVTDANDNEALNVSDLRCVFSVRKAREQANYATISIYNLTADIERKIIMEGSRIVIEAGYEGYLTTGNDKTISETASKQYGKIFDGKIIYPTRYRENNTDYVLTLLCVDGETPLNLNFISKTVNRGLNQRQIIETACNDAISKISVGSISEGLNGAKLPRGKVFFGQPQEYFSDVVRGNAATYWIEDDVLTVHKWTDPDESEAIQFTPKTGLVGMPQQTQFGAKWTLLLNPNIHIKTKCQLAETDIVERSAVPNQQQAPLDDDWIYQVTELVHRGDTRGNEWYTECTGVSRYGKGALPALMANNATNPNGV